MAVPTGAMTTPSGYPIIDPDTINPQADWPNIEQAQADWIDTHVIHRFATKAAMLVARPSMPPGQSGFAFTVNDSRMWQWSGTAWVPLGGFRMESGVVTHNYAGGVGPVTTNVTFAAPFTTTPAITLTCNTVNLQLYYGGAGAGGFQVNSRGFNAVAPPTASYSISWIAVGT